MAMSWVATLALDVTRFLSGAGAASAGAASASGGISSAFHRVLGPLAAVRIGSDALSFAFDNMRAHAAVAAAVQSGNAVAMAEAIEKADTTYANFAAKIPLVGSAAKSVWDEIRGTDHIAQLIANIKVGSDAVATLEKSARDTGNAARLMWLEVSGAPESAKAAEKATQGAAAGARSLADAEKAVAAARKAMESASESVQARGGPFTRTTLAERLKVQTEPMQKYVQALKSYWDLQDATALSQQAREMAIDNARAKTAQDTAAKLLEAQRTITDFTVTEVEKRGALILQEEKKAADALEAIVAAGEITWEDYDRRIVDIQSATYQKLGALVEDYAAKARDEQQKLYAEAAQREASQQRVLTGILNSALDERNSMIEDYTRRAESLQREAGSQRESWEDRVYRSIYEHAAPGQRPQIARQMALGIERQAITAGQGGQFGESRRLLGREQSYLEQAGDFARMQQVQSAIQRLFAQERDQARTAASAFGRVNVAQAGSQGVQVGTVVVQVSEKLDRDTIRNLIVGEMNRLAARGRATPAALAAPGWGAPVGVISSIGP